MTTLINRWAVAALLAAGFLVLAACSKEEPAGARQADAAEAGTLEKARKSGRIRIGYANEAPFAYFDSGSNRLTGESPEIARVILGQLGVPEVEGVLTEFGALIPGLQAGRFDLIAAGMYILPKRCEQVIFSNPSYTIGQAFLVRVGNPKKLHAYADVAASSDATIGVVAGAVEREYARKSGIPDDRVVVFPNPPSALAGVESARVDAFAATSLTVQTLLSRSQDAKVERATPFSDPVIDGKPIRGYGAFAFRKTDAQFAKRFNAELAKFIGTPEHFKVVGEFGFSQGELAVEKSTDELCRG
jgi:polar amino acid transport system substrate-binding protein